MRTSLVTLVVAAALALTACDDASTTTSPGRVVVPTPTTSATGNPFGDPPAPRAEPTAVPERDQTKIQPMVYSLDPCAVLKAAGSRPGDYQTGPRGCGAQYDAKPRVDVVLDDAFDDDARYNAQRLDSNGVAVYLERREGACTYARVPFSQDRALTLEADYDDAKACATLTRAVGQLTRTLTTRPASLQSRTPSASNIPLCTLLSAAVGTVAKNQRIGTPRYGRGCAIQEQDPDAREGAAETERWSDTAVLDVWTSSRKREPTSRASERADQPWCELTGPGWNVGDLPRGFDDATPVADLQLQARGTCDQARALYQKVVAASRSLKPAIPTLNATSRFWYASTEPDRVVTGSCTTVSEAATSKCAPYTETEAPTGRAAILKAAAVNPNVTCAVAREVVAARYPALTQISTVEPSRRKECVFSEAGRLTEVRVALEADTSVYAEEATREGELTVGEDYSSMRHLVAGAASASKGRAPGRVSVAVGSRTSLDARTTEDPAAETRTRAPPARWRSNWATRCCSTEARGSGSQRRAYRGAP